MHRLGRQHPASAASQPLVSARETSAFFLKGLFSPSSFLLPPFRYLQTRLVSSDIDARFACGGTVHHGRAELAWVFVFFRSHSCCRVAICGRAAEDPQVKQTPWYLPRHSIERLVPLYRLGAIGPKYSLLCGKPSVSRDDNQYTDVCRSASTLLIVPMQCHP